LFFLPASAIMYNGVGLYTPRGSGTSGYVATNKFNLRQQPPQRDQRQEKGSMGPPAQRQPNQGIMEHKRKRDVEVKLLVERDRLEEEG